MKQALQLAQWLSRQLAPAWSPREPTPLPWGSGQPPATLPPQAQALYLRGWGFAPTPVSGEAAAWCGPVDAAQPNCVAFGAGADCAVAGDTSGQVFLLRRDARLDGWRGLRLGSHAGAVSAVAVRADGRRAVSACHSGSLKVWLLDGSGPAAEVQAFQLGDEIERIALSGDALHAVTATRQGGLQVWDLDDAKGIASGATWFHRSDAVRQLAMNGNGSAFLAARAEGLLQWFSGVDGAGAAARTLRLPPGTGLAHVAIASDAAHAAAVLDDDVVCLWPLDDLGADRDARVWRGLEVVAPRLVALDGARCIVATADGRLRLSELGEAWGLHSLAVWPGCEGGARDLAIDAARQRAWSASGDGVLRLWDLADPLRREPLVAWRGAPDWVRRVVVNAGASHAVAVAHDGMARLWSLDADDHQPPRAVWRAHERSVEAFALAADAQSAVSGGGDGSLRLWWLPPGAPAEGIADWKDHSGPVDAIALSPDGRRAVSASHDQSLAVRDLIVPVRTEPLAVWRGHDKGAHLVALSADATRAVSSAYDNTLRVWDLANPTSAEALAVWRGHESLVTHIALSRDGQRAVSASYDSTLRVWNLGVPASTEPTVIWRGHRGVVRHVALADDGSCAVSAGDDGTLRVWNFALGAGSDEALAVWRGHEGPVQQLAISSDSRRVVSVGDDRTLRVWDLADLKRNEPLAVWHLLHRAGAVGWHGARIVASGVDGWTVFDGADETARPRAWRALATTLLVAPQTTLRVSAAGIELAHEDAIHTELDAEGRLLPADPRIFGLLTFAAGEALFDAWHLAHRIDWPDEPQPRRFRVRWGSDGERQRWLPRLEPAPGGHDAG